MEILTNNGTFFKELDRIKDIELKAKYIKISEDRQLIKRGNI